VLETLGYEVIEPRPQDSDRPACCGRTFLAAGLIDQAKHEARRFIETVMPWVRQGIPVIGLEPSCLLTLRDEFLALLPGDDANALAKNAFLFEEFLEREIDASRCELNLKPIHEPVYLHGHCHQKAARTMSPVQKLLGRIPNIQLTTIESSCCGMAGHFGYQAETFETSKEMAELSLLPAVRELPSTARVVADGTSCRHQMADLANRQADHVAVLLAEFLDRD
jgi:Fe-S oxidoreductase